MSGGYDLSRPFVPGEGSQVQWTMHTTMNLDVRFVAAVIAMQMSGKPEPDEEEYAEALKPENQGRIAFFYDGSKKNKPVCRGSVKAVPVKNCEYFCYPLDSQSDAVETGAAETGSAEESHASHQSRQTFHAKISLTCCEPERYQLAVYSKNAVYGSEGLLESAVLLDVGFGEEETKDGVQLQNFLRKISDSTNGMGKEWLAGHKLQPEGALFKKLGTATFTAADTKEPANLFFGGCGGVPLYQFLNLGDCLDDSIVLTPPSFVHGAARACRDFFSQEKPILWDIDKEHRGLDNEKRRSSHVKLYLLCHAGNGAPSYSLYTGSANATPRGIGWNFEPGKDSGKNEVENIECLVKLRCGEARFKALREEIKGLGFRTTKDFTNGSLSHTPDPWTEVLDGARITKVEYEQRLDAGGNLHVGDKIARIVFTVKLKEKLKEKKEARAEDGGCVPLKFRPMEYNAVCVEKNFSDDTEELKLIYQTPGKFLRLIRSQGYLLCGCESKVDPDIMLPFDPSAFGVPENRGVITWQHYPYLSRAMEKEPEDAADWLRSQRTLLENISNEKLREKLSGELDAMIKLFRELSKERQV